MLRNVALVASLTVASLLPAQAPLPDITTPKESIGFNMGDDYCLANNVQLEKYWRTLSLRLRALPTYRTEPPSSYIR